MSKKRNKHRKTGLPPGSLVYTGEADIKNPDVSIVQYNEAYFSAQLLRGLDCLPARAGFVTWYDVRGLSKTDVVEHVGQTFDVHTLALEDVLNTQQRPKWEDYNNGIFLVVRAMRLEETSLELTTEQVSFYLKTDVLISFQEDKEDLFVNIRERLEKKLGKIRTKGADFLLYALLDYIVDSYFLLLDRTEEVIGSLESEILYDWQNSSRNKIYSIKRILADIRRAVLPMRDVVSRFSHEDGRFVELANNIYIRDLYDHVNQVIDILEDQRDMVNSLNDLYNNEMAQRSNHVMKVLTIVSAIFIPLTFIVGVYGTNFRVLPELENPYGYYVMWGVMLAIAVLQLIYFKWKKWL